VDNDQLASTFMRPNDRLEVGQEIEIVRFFVVDTKSKNFFVGTIGDNEVAMSPAFSDLYSPTLPG